MTNLYPGRCECGAWVLKGRGIANPPVMHGHWIIKCFLCATPEEQDYLRRVAADLARVQQDHDERASHGAR